MEIDIIISKIDALDQKIDFVKETMEGKLIEESCKIVSQNWLPRSLLMKYFGYADTQMTAIAKKYKINQSKIGSRIFYHRESVEKVLRDNQVMSH